MVSKKAGTELWNEDRLISLLKDGHEGAFRALVRQYRESLFGIAYGITLDREESLDIVQEVFLKVHQKIHTFGERSSLSTWLHRITVNQSLNWQRKFKRRFKWHHQPLERDESGDLEELGTDNHSPETLYQEKEFEKRFREGLEGLAEGSRAVFVLKEIEGLSYDEIASIFGINRGTVSSRLFYARKELRKVLDEYLNGD